MSLTAPFRFTKPHALALLERLHRENGAAEHSETCRLFFVDIDVLSTYINGQNGDIRSDWSSLFSLTSDEKPSEESSISDDARSLSDAIAKSVTGFLMGGFREDRPIQSGRLYLTPEHSRELDTLIHAVLRQQIPAVGKWQTSLYQEYMALTATTSDQTQDATNRLNDIFQILRTNSPAGKIARAYDVRRRMTSTFTQAPLFPPADLGSAFLMRADTAAFQRRTTEVARLALTKLLDRLKASQRNLTFWPAIAFLINLMFSIHKPTSKLGDYIGHALDNEELHAIIPDSAPDKERWVRQSARIAAIQVSDLYALGRLVTLGEFLRRDHPLKKSFKWQISLLSGARILEDLLATLHSDEIGMNVEIVHPLSVMRFDEFLRPQNQSGARNDSQTEILEDMTGHEYALGLLGDPKAALKSLDEGKFFGSLTSLLSKASAGYAYQHDRSLQNIQRQLRSDSTNHARIVRVVGNLVTSEFIQTYSQVNRLGPPEFEKLPMVSLPWLALPLPGVVSSPAEIFVARVHEQAQSGSSDSRFSMEQDVTELVRSDPTGYTACVCAALGYLAMGSDHLLSAETASNTAARTVSMGAIGAVDGAYVPEGNEALYLSAFVSRMRISPEVEHRRAAFEWRNTHRQLMILAKARCMKWQNDWPDLANQSLEGINMRSVDLIQLRYDIEDSARDVFCMMIDILAPHNGDGVQPGTLWEGDADALVVKLVKIIDELKSVGADSVNTSSHTELAFIRAQLVVALVQFWLCERVRSEKNGTSRVFSEELEHLIDQSLRLMPRHDSVLLEGLNLLFDMHRTKIHRQGETKRFHKFSRYKKFAAIDTLRLPFLERLGRLLPGQLISEALSV